MARDLRHAARPHAGARQAGRGAGAAGAAAPARRAAADRRGWETPPLPAPDGSGAFGRHPRPARRTRPSSSTSTAAAQRIPLTPDRAVGAVTRDVLEAVRALAGDVPIDAHAAGGPLDGRRSTRTSEHATYDAGRRSAAYFAAATRAAQVLAAYRAPYRGRSTPVNAWWGSFDLAVSLFSGEPAAAAVGRLHHAQRDGRAGGRRRLVAGRRALRQGRVLRLRATRRPTASAARALEPAAARWDGALGEYLLDWDDVLASRRPARHRRSPSRARPSARLRGLRLGSGAAGQRRGTSLRRSPSRAPRRRRP